MTGADQRFFCMVVTATAGATLRDHALASFDPPEVYPCKDLDPNLLVADHRIGYLTGLPPERRTRIRAFAGHFPFVAFELLEIDALTLTVLRDPVERTISFLRARKRKHAPRQRLSLQEIYEDRSHFESFIKDHQAKLFALSAQDRPESYMQPFDVDAERLATAKSNLERVDLLGLEDRFDELLSELERRFGWRRAQRDRLNASSGRDVPASFRRRIAEDNVADMEFYEYALELYDRRHGTAARRAYRPVAVTHRRVDGGTAGSRTMLEVPPARRATIDRGMRESLPSPGPRFFYLHVMKTAGGTLREHIRANFERDEVYPLRGLDTDLLEANTRIDYLTGLPPERRERIRVFMGHFPFVAVQLMGLEAFTFTLLRDPVDRTLSYLRHCKRRHEHHRRLSLEEIYEDRPYFDSFIKNHQVKLFALTAEDRPASYADVLDIDADRLAVAKTNLEAVDLMGLQDRFGEFLAQLESRFGWRFRTVVDRHVSRSSDVPASFRRRIAEDNAADIEFYEHARELYDRLHGSRPSP